MRIYVFVDSQNLNLTVKKSGWTLDFSKFFVYLKDKYRVEKVFLFLGYVPRYQKLYSFLRKIGYEIVFKPILGKGVNYIKGNCDADLVLQCMIEYKNYDQAIIISGDGDFYCLIKYLDDQGKLFKVGIPNNKSFSALLRKFHRKFFYINTLRKKLE